MDNNIVNSPIPEHGRHTRKCSVCRHPEREAIEEAFLHWHSPTEIATDYELPDSRPLYRHAHATGLFDRRRRNVAFVLENFIERVNEIQVVTPGAIVQAIRAYTRISKNGEWIEPPRQIIVTHVMEPEDPQPQVPVQAAGQFRATGTLQGEPDIMQIITPKPSNPNRQSAIRTPLNPLKTKEGDQV